MALFLDDYGIVDTDNLIAVVPMTIEDDPRFAATPHALSMILQVGSAPKRCLFAYPSRVLRDKAFERLLALLKEEENVSYEEVLDDDVPS